MSLLRKLVKVFLVISLFIFLIPVTKEVKVKKRVEKVTQNNNIDNIYSGFIYIPKFDYKNLIKEGEDSLDQNLVELTNFSDKIGENKIILAGHNNRYVFNLTNSINIVIVFLILLSINKFNKIYNLDIGDQIIISDFSVDYSYKVKETKIIKVDDFSYFNEDGLYLITCTNNNQQRYVIKAKREY